MQAADIVKEFNLYSSETQNVQELVDYAKNISKYTSAPLDYNQEKSLQIAEPPYPSELKIRMGLLNSYTLEDSNKVEEIQDVDSDNHEHTFNDQEYSLDLDACDLLLDLDLNPDLE
ncbi:hypothetical protein BB561_004324 [Smittium simulii]|uniref:Mediator of RNA polymerase II transcription subunit 4 n=1 Tax=Smittium simulii TaxID=133385 RepID=A0A2T9YGV6_9FUNG|nr:hypothetical protein BB561_004324 [Smittium simulii]